MLRLNQINIGTVDDIRFLFETRTHPEIIKYLFGNPPVSIEVHTEWLLKNVPNYRRMFILFDGDIRVGYCHAYDFFDKDTIEVGFVIHPDYQGNGYGSFMVGELVKIIQGIMPEKKIILYVHIGNDRAIGLYKKHGFIEKEQKGSELLFEYIK
jgi:RimJ/RimL family protein N-acetyltransferase